MSSAAALRAPQVLVETSHTLPLVSMSMYMRSGTGHEPEAQRGIMRIAARMLRRGTPTMNAQQIDERLDELGAELTVDVSTETTGLHLTVLRRNLGAITELLADLLQHASFPESEVAKLVRETIAEIGDSRDSDRHLAHRSLRRAMFGAHSYGRRSAGRVATLQALTAEGVRAYANAQLVNDNMLFGFSGDITQAQAEEIAAKLSRTRPTIAAPASVLTDAAMPKGRHLIFVDKPDRSQTQVMIGRLGTAPHDADHIPLSVANTIFGGTFTSRMMREVRSKRGWSYGAGSSLAVDKCRHEFTMSTSPAAKDAAACLALELQLLEQLVADGVKDSELKFTKGYLKRSYAFERDTAAKRLGQLADEALLALPENYHAGYLARVAAVTRDSANAALKARLSPADLFIVVVGTHAELGAEIRAACGELASETVVPYMDVE